MPECWQCQNTEVFGAEMVAGRDAVLVTKLFCTPEGEYIKQQVTVDKIKATKAVGSTQFYCWSCSSTDVDWFYPPLSKDGNLYAPQKTKPKEGVWFRRVTSTIFELGRAAKVRAARNKRRDVEGSAAEK